MFWTLLKSKIHRVAVTQSAAAVVQREADAVHVGDAIGLAEDPGPVDADIQIGTAGNFKGAAVDVDGADPQSRRHRLGTLRVTAEHRGGPCGPVGCLGVCEFGDLV